jgi:hypothetical protein
MRIRAVSISIRENWAKREFSVDDVFQFLPEYNKKSPAISRTLLF